MINEELEISSEIERDSFIKIISDLQSQIIPPLDEMGVDIKEYANKLYKNADLLVAYKKGEIVGVAAVYANDEVSRCAYLSFIAIYNKFQGQGYGAALLSCVEEKAKQNNMYDLKLEVFKKNKRALVFYNRNKYIQIDETIDSYILEKKIITGYENENM